MIHGVWQSTRVDYSTLNSAIQFGSVDVVKEVLEKGVNPNESKDGNYVLLSTCYAGGQYELAKLLLEFGADVNVQRASNGLTALHIACGAIGDANYVKYEFVELLLDYGADVTIEDEKGHTALYYAKEKYEKYKDYDTDELAKVISLLESAKV
jgi:ankyrin repeat protein